jgi:hypothetical protein
VGASLNSLPASNNPDTVISGLTIGDTSLFYAYDCTFANSADAALAVKAAGSYILYKNMSIAGLTTNIISGGFLQAY